MEHCTNAFESNPRYIKALTRRLKVYDALGMKKDAILGEKSSRVCMHTPNTRHVLNVISADVTRVLVLDESQGRSLSQTVAKLLKDFGSKQAKENFSVCMSISKYFACLLPLSVELAVSTYHNCDCGTHTRVCVCVFRLPKSLFLFSCTSRNSRP